jgi:GNAT superfamily N-acetyltransferase
VSDVLVRAAREGDLDALLALYAELGEGDSAREPASRATAEPTLRTTLADPLRTLAVGELDGTVVGTADLIVIPNLTHRGDPWAVVENVVVAASARRRGVGRALLAHLVDVARDAGCYKLQLLTGKQRVEAHAFYAAIGLRPLAEGFKLYFDDTATLVP